MHLSQQMMPTLRACVVIAGAILVPAPALAAQETLTLDQAVQEAMERNATLKGARAGADAEASRITEAQSRWFPQVTVTEMWQRGTQPVFVFSSLLSSRQFAAANFAIDALNHPDPVGFFRSSVSIGQVLFDGARRPAIDGATLRHEIARLAADETSAGLAVSTVQTYGRVLLAHAGQRAADAALQAAREDLARAERRRDIGLATDGDVLALVAHVASLQQRLIQHEGDAAVARAELNRLTGAPITRHFLVALPPALPGEHPTADLSALLAEAEQARPELQRSAAVLRLAEADSRNARAALLPQIAAQGAVDISGTSFDDRASAWIVGAEVRWTFSLGGAELSRSKAASHARTRASAEAEASRAAVHVEVATAFRRLETARARHVVARAAVDQARESHRITRDRFDAGLATVTDVLRASSAVVDAEAQQIEAAVDTLVSDAMLARAVGRKS